MYLVPIIAVNSPDIEKSILRLNTKPLDPTDIARLWKVFHSARRNISDPTFKWIRLENFWWRIWGSRQKNQSGHILGDLFRWISDQCNPLSPDGLISSDEKSSRNKSKITSHAEFEAQGKIGNVTTAEPTSRVSCQNISNTTSVVPHPILKKTRGPSTNGPRPTARFISPHETEDEHPVVQTKPKSNAQLSSNSFGDSKSDKKPISGPLIPKKKSAFVSPRKKQPMVLRRQNSHSSSDNFSGVPGPNQMKTKSSSITDIMSPLPDSIKCANKNPPLENYLLISHNTSRISQTPVLSEPSICVNTNPSPFYSDETPQNLKEPFKRYLQETVVSAECCQAEDSKDENRFKSHGIYSIIREIQLSELQPDLPTTVKSHSGESISGDGYKSFTNFEQHSDQPFRQTLLDSKEKISLPTKSVTCNFAQTNEVEPITAESVNDAMKNRKKLYSAAITRQGINPKNIDDSKSYIEEFRIPADVFSKRPIELSMPKSTSTDLLSRSKSQLTLLLERDRVKTGGKYSNQVKDKA